MLVIALIYGSLSGLVTIGTIVVGFLLGANGNAAGFEWLGYLVMLLAFTLIFVGIKRYRDGDLGGVIRFLPALLTGLAIALVASVIYVLVWELYLALTGHAFVTTYAASVMDQLRASGATAEAIAAKQAELDALVAAYANPPYRMAITFIEIFPVGLIVALVSAILLRNPRLLPATAPQGAAS